MKVVFIYLFSLFQILNFSQSFFLFTIVSFWVVQRFQIVLVVDAFNFSVPLTPFLFWVISGIVAVCASFFNQNCSVTLIKSRAVVSVGESDMQPITKFLLDRSIFSRKWKSIKVQCIPQGECSWLMDHAVSDRVHFVAQMRHHLGKLHHRFYVFWFFDKKKLLVKPKKWELLPTFFEVIIFSK